MSDGMFWMLVLLGSIAAGMALTPISYHVTAWLSALAEKARDQVRQRRARAAARRRATS